jgi:protoporphyrinogen IX oxidase
MLWIKTFHILFVMAWVACVFTVPRILLQWKSAVDAKSDFAGIRILAIKFFRFGCVMAVLAMAFGIWLWLAYGFGGRWLHLKLTLVVLLLVHFLIAGSFIIRATKSGTFLGGVALKFYNEAPLLFIIPIIYLVLAKPA